MDNASSIFVKAYVHKDMGAEARSISGYYTYLEEGRLKFGEREILYSVGVGVVDNSCCGSGGCLFVDVHGYVISWKSEYNEERRLISRVEQITENHKEGVQKGLQALFPHAQIRFDY